ncbi:MAG UNVERIFIED_CONTAM: flagellar hook-basal body complex protein FliE [Rickettsiaceae bacterium]|jgi:flagellar hook-basal body complex protein FliE
MANIISPAQLLQAQSTYTNKLQQNNALPEMDPVAGAAEFQNMVRANFNKFANMRPEQIIAQVKQTNSTNSTNTNREDIASGISTVSNMVRKGEYVNVRSIGGDASLSEVIASASEVKATLQTAVAFRNKLFEAFEKVMSMQV